METNTKAELLKESLEVNLKQAYKFLTDSSVNEIIVNPDGKVWLDQAGQKAKINTGIVLPETNRRQIIYLIAGYINSASNEKKPLLEADFLNMRFQGFLPNSVSSPAFNIRKHTSKVFSFDDYIKNETINTAQKEYILRAIDLKKNIIVAGPTGTGKTTFVNTILAEISKLDQRVVIIEDTPELLCAAKDLLALRTDKENDITMDMLLRATLRANPDRIILGEIRGEEAITLLDAWNTGHDGGVSTIHASTAKSTLSRLEGLVMRKFDKPQQHIIGEAVDLIIYIDIIGIKRKVRNILEVNGYNKMTEEYILNEVVL